MIPQLLHRFRTDPALWSRAFVTTVTDVVGYSSFLGIATLWFGLGWDLWVVSSRWVAARREEVFLLPAEDLTAAVLGPFA